MFNGALNRCSLFILFCLLSSTSHAGKFNCNWFLNLKGKLFSSQTSNDKQSNEDPKSVAEDPVTKDEVSIDEFTREWLIEFNPKRNMLSVLAKDLADRKKTFKKAAFIEPSNSLSKHQGFKLDQALKYKVDSETYINFSPHVLELMGLIYISSKFQTNIEEIEKKKKFKDEDLSSIEISDALSRVKIATGDKEPSPESKRLLIKLKKVFNETDRGLKKSDMLLWLDKLIQMGAQRPGRNKTILLTDAIKAFHALSDQPRFNIIAKSNLIRLLVSNRIYSAVEEDVHNIMSLGSDELQVQYYRQFVQMAYELEFGNELKFFDIFEQKKLPVDSDFVSEIKAIYLGIFESELDADEIHKEYYTDFYTDLLAREEEIPYLSKINDAVASWLIHEEAEKKMSSITVAELLDEGDHDERFVRRARLVEDIAKRKGYSKEAFIEALTLSTEGWDGLQL